MKIIVQFYFRKFYIIQTEYGITLRAFKMYVIILMMALSAAIRTERIMQEFLSIQNRLKSGITLFGQHP